ncbi:MAG: hypothetical protein AAFR66_23575 [Bacteroidota bacterium]
MLKQFVWLVLVLVSPFSGLFGQMIFIHPPYPGVNDSISIYFNAEYGNQALKDIGEEVYLHTGVILGPDSASSTWYYIQGEWAQHDPKVLMERMGPNLYRKKVHIKTFYRLPKDLEVNKLAFVFRNKDGSKVGTPMEREESWYSLNPPIPKIPEDTSQVLPEIFKPLTIQQLASSDSLSQKVYIRTDTLFFPWIETEEMQILDLGQYLEIPALLSMMTKKKIVSINITPKVAGSLLQKFYVFQFPFQKIRQINLGNNPLLEVPNKEEFQFWENSFFLENGLLYLHLENRPDELSLSIKY